MCTATGYISGGFNSVLLGILFENLRIYLCSVVPSTPDSASLAAMSVPSHRAKYSASYATGGEPFQLLVRF